MKRTLLLVFVLLSMAVVGGAQVPWTVDYNMGLSPEQNGFSRQYYPIAGVVNQITTGAPSSRRVEVVNSIGGGVVFFTSQVPTFDPNIGITGEMEVSVSGSEDAVVGIELTMMDYVVLVDVYQSRVHLYGGIDSPNVFIDTVDNSVRTIFRLLFKSNREVELYRNNVLLLGPYVWGQHQMPYQRFMWWGEGEGTINFYGLRYWAGGAEVP